MRTWASLICVLVLLSSLPVGGLVFAGDPNADKIREIPSPAEASAALEAADGYQVNLYASEVTAPLHNPMSMAIDPAGRIWVITSPTYPHYDPGVAPCDKILVFEDTDGDGVADEHTVFADGLYIPTGIALDVDGGVWVGQQPDLWYMQDTDGDLVADVKKIVLHGFGTEDSHHSLSAFTWGPDRSFYFNEGVFHHSQIETPYGPIRAVDAAVFRFEPSTHRLTVASHRGYANPWGHAFDRWGQSVLSDASGGAHFNFAHVIPAFDYPEKIIAPKPLMNRGRPMAGNVILSSGHFPPDVQGTHLNNQSIGFHGTRWDRLIDHGSGFKHEPLPDLLSSTDFAFRPVAAEIGADGAIYILDYCNRRLGHMQYTHRDPDRDHTHGRIWRVSHKNRALLEPKKIVGATVTELLALLSQPENHVRHFARQELQTRATAEVEPALASWIERLDPADEQYEHLLCEAMWVYQGRDRVRVDLVERLLAAEHPLARAAAVRVVRHWTEAGVIEPAESLRLITPAVQDPNERVRLEGVLACGFVASADAAGLALLASEQSMDHNFGKVLEQTLRVLKKYGPPPEGIGRRFQLYGSSAKQLSETELDETVAGVQLERPDLVAGIHEKAVDYLADARVTSSPDVLLTEIERLDPQERDAGVCVELLASRPIDALLPHAPRLIRLAKTAVATATRSAAIALLLSIERDVGKVTAHDLSPTVVMAAVPLIRDTTAVAAVYSQVKDAIGAGEFLLRRAAMRSAVRLPAQRRETYGVLAALVDGADRAVSRAAHMAMNEVQLSDWPSGFDRYRMESVDPTVFARGREVYHREGLCVTCHKADGRGVFGSYPPLDGTPRVLGSDKTLSRIVLHGLRDRIRVRGTTYRSAMAPLGNILSDGEIADALTYVRNAWGNRAPGVSKVTVAEIRRANRRRTISWTDALLISEEIDDTVVAHESEGDPGDPAGVAGTHADPSDRGAGAMAFVVWAGAGLVGMILLYMLGTVLTMRPDERVGRAGSR